jgi:phage FluMu protein Com
MAIEANPLKQYFRRPSIYVKLPSGGNGYAPGVVNLPDSGELPIYPMTAIDEITARTPDALFNGSAVVELIKSCVPDIKDPWSIFSTDMDSILIGIKSASQGNELEIETECPKCEEVSKFGVNLVAVLSTLKEADYTQELLLGDLAIKFRPLTYKEMNEANIKQFEIQRLFMSIESIENEDEKVKKTQEAIVSITETTMQILAKTIEYVKTPSSMVTNTNFVMDYLHNCDKNTYMTIRDYHSKMKEQAELKPLDIKCPHCQNEYKKPFVLNTSDFFG